MLSEPKNRHLVTRIKAALAAGIRPGAMLFREQPTDPWTDMDFKLLEAYQMLQDEICPQCGFPVWLCRSVDDTIEWSASTDVCYASRRKELEDWKLQNRGKKGKDKKSSPDKEEKAAMGRFTYVTPRVAANYSGSELPTRKEYYESLVNG